MISCRPLQALLLLAAVMSQVACTNPFATASEPSANTPTSDSFSGSLAPGGAVVFTFSVTTAGSVGVTLTSVSPSTTSALGLGVGPSSNGTCSVTNSTSSAVAGSAAQLTANANPGTYCVRVSDAGSLAATSTVTVAVAHS
jgi:hypothetical protein